jgi:hypothetical protein
VFCTFVGAEKLSTLCKLSQTHQNMLDERLKRGWQVQMQAQQQQEEAVAVAQQQAEEEAEYEDDNRSSDERVQAHYNQAVVESQHQQQHQQQQQSLSVNVAASSPPADRREQSHYGNTGQADSAVHISTGGGGGGGGILDFHPSQPAVPVHLIAAPWFQGLASCDVEALKHVCSMLSENDRAVIDNAGKNHPFLSMSLSMSALN